MKYICTWSGINVVNEGHTVHLLLPVCVGHRVASGFITQNKITLKVQIWCTTEVSGGCSSQTAAQCRATIGLGMII